MLRIVIAAMNLPDVDFDRHVIIDTRGVNRRPLIPAACEAFARPAAGLTPLCAAPSHVQDPG